LFDLVFFSSNFVSSDCVDHGFLYPVPFYPPFIIDCTISLQRNNHNFNTPYKRYSAGDYVLL
jgi:hypothetical protein